ncbi:dihydroxyacetone kinase-like protein [Lipingzhangella halophila]|uniref:Dihydroxyacetone kinase-like protein n=1 Tax=Lipingzhangella halophila TaxID=1783352 RepID=A0A7W7RIN1_9ACTN|nr:dihydroxyacetone kinase subunit DhaL [Lipingzhangella halophila]MBB4932615.1 dihydroxyacetone kinase-like protein [Lipingzhangella halophila]
MDTDLARAWMLAVAESIEADRERLSRLDAEIGDGDHGTNMHRGFSAVREALDGVDSPSASTVLVKTGTTLISRVGGASGPLYGTVFRTVGKQLGAGDSDVAELAAALSAGRDDVCRLGSAQVGDKTMVDALSPAVDALTAADPAGGLGPATRAAAEAAEKGAESTIPLQARKGRASYLGERSAGHLDPGAASTALIFRALADVARG